MDHSNGRVRPSKLFFIRCSGFEYYGAIREDFVESLPDPLTFCVAVEESDSKSKVSCHLHCYVEFIEKWLLTDLGDYLRLCFPDCTFDIQKAKSRRNCLKYVSKEDKKVYFNCKKSELHFNYRAYRWAVENPIFEFSHPFVLEHRFCWNFLRQLHSEVNIKKDFVFNGFRPLDYYYNDWTLQCVNWWNDVIKNTTIKKKALYLYGPTNVGKSSFVELMIGRMNLPFVFYPGCGKFFMQGFRSEFHKLILFEEFACKFYPVSMLKRLIEGRPYAYPVKGQSDLMICYRGPLLFVSNDCVVEDEALNARFLFVSALASYYEEKTMGVPKTEVPSPSKSSVCSLSSEDPFFSSEEDSQDFEKENNPNTQNVRPDQYDGPSTSLSLH